jgi:hypothetical protein
MPEGPAQFGVRDLLWWTFLAAFICGAMVVPVYQSANPWISRAGFAFALVLAAWRVRHQFRSAC